MHNEKKKTFIHPLNLYSQKIKEEGIVVLNGVRGLPTGKKPFISPDYVICVGHRGHIDLMYDDYADYSERYTIGVIFPNHTLKDMGKTDDHLASLIVVDAAVLKDPLLQIIKQMRYRYEPHPCVKLDKHEYKIIMNVVAEAKMLLHIRCNLTVQAIADMMGFDEQASFSRYFHRETGMSSSEFRERN